MRVGKYELIRELGSGAMGVVFLAHDTELNRRVALKQIRETSARALARFAIEAKAAARLQHPNVVTLHEAQLEGPHPYLVMRYVEGKSLEAVLERRGRLEGDEAVAITIQLADALAHAHAQGVIHRDVKPANVLLDAGGQAYLSDFGLARNDDESLEALTRTGQIVGTPAFMAPEQARGERAAIGPATDVYGLGATLYAMLSGRAPHERTNMMALVAAVTHEAPTPLRTLVPDVDPVVERIVRHCLEKRPGDRYPTATALAEALRDRRAPPRVSSGRGRGVALASGALAMFVTLLAIGGRPLAPAEPPARPRRPADGAPSPGASQRSAPVDSRWEKALLRMDDDPIKACRLALSAEGEPPPPLKRALLDRVDERVPIGGLFEATREAKLRREQWMACAQLWMRVSGRQPPLRWLEQLLRLRASSSSDSEAFLFAVIPLFESRYSAKPAELVLDFAGASARVSYRRWSWVGLCRRLADRVDWGTSEWALAQGKLLGLLEGAFPPSPTRELDVAHWAIEVVQRTAALRGHPQGRSQLARNARTEAAARLQLGDSQGALRVAQRGWERHRDADCLGLSALAMYASGPRRHGAALSREYLRRVGVRTPSTALQRLVISVLWDETPRDPELATAVFKLVEQNPRFHGWYVRRALLELRQGRLREASQTLRGLKTSISRGTYLCDRMCRTRHDSILRASPSRLERDLPDLVSSLDRYRKKRGDGLP